MRFPFCRRPRRFEGGDGNLTDSRKIERLRGGHRALNADPCSYQIFALKTQLIGGFAVFAGWVSQDKNRGAELAGLDTKIGRLTVDLFRKDWGKSCCTSLVGPS